MHSIAFSIFSLQIHWYGIMAACGFLTALLVLLLLRKRSGLEKEQVYDIGVIAIVCGIAGARIFYVIQFYRQFEDQSFLEIFRIDKGGLVFYGGFILAFSMLFLYAKRKHISFLGILDIFAPAILLAHACGRIGCFLQGCCFGKPAPGGFCGVVFPAGSGPALRYPSVPRDLYALGDPAGSAPSLPLYPVQLIEAGALVLFGLALLFALPRLKKPGQSAGIYLFGYGILRSLTECLRGDHTDFFFGIFTPAQTTALFVMIPLGLILFFMAGHWKKTEHTPHAG